MPAFTAIAVYIVGAIGVTGLAATILSSVIATGLAMVTSRLINGNPGGGGGGGQESQGTRVQLAPDTSNKIPVVYGEGFLPSIVTDAYLHDENKWMTYVMVIGETHNQYALFTGSVNATNSRLYVTGAPENGTGTLHVGMTLYNTAGGKIGVVEEWLDGIYGSIGTYRISSPVETASSTITGDYVYTVKDIYWNDNRLVFDGTNKGGPVISGKKYVDNLPYNPETGAKNEEDHTDTNFKDHAEVYVYARNSTNTSALGVASPKPAYQVVATGKEWKAPNLPGAERMEGLIFAVVKIKYDAEKGFTGIPSMTFHLHNSLDNPAVVLYDYMRSDRYGAFIGNASINDEALGDYANFCNELVSYQPFGSSAPATTQKRYTINGLIDTNSNVMDNINTIATNGGAWLAYDVNLGQWKIIPKRGVEYNASYPNRKIPASLLRFTDDNIIGGIQINSTRLDDLYNMSDIEFFDAKLKDQRGFRSIEINSTERNYNEPDNSLRLTLDLCNSNVQAERIANLELKQSRDDLIVGFKTTHYGLQVAAGDVIQLESSLYGWGDPVFPGGKKFRVLTAKEVEDAGGGLMAEITALEYNADVYSDESISEFITSRNIGIIPRDSSVNIPAPIVVPVQGGVNSTGGVPNFKLKIELPKTGGPFDEIQLWYSEGDDWAGVGGDMRFMAQANGNNIWVVDWYGPGVVRSETDSGVATTISGWNSTLSRAYGGDYGIPDGTSIQAFGAFASSYYGNGQTGYYTLNQTVPNNTARIICSGTVNASEIQGSVANDQLTITAHSGEPLADQSLLQFGVESCAITSAKIVGTSLYVYELSGTLVPHADTGTQIVGNGLLPFTRIKKQLENTEPDGTPGKRGVYELNIAQSQQDMMKIKGYWPNLLNNTIILNQISGTTGGVGVYTLNKGANIAGTAVGYAKYPYPKPSTYEYLKSIKPEPGSSLLFNQNDVRDTFISSLPANGLNKKYFVKARLGIAGSYGPFSELGEVDLEPPVVYWNPDSASALNIKEELVKMDFGKFTIPRNGLWLMRTAMVLDGGIIKTPQGDSFNLDLGDLTEESTILANDLIQDFTFDPPEY